MAIADYIFERQKHGEYTFSFDQLKRAHPDLQPKTITNELAILARKGLIVSPYKGFYSVVLPHYQLRGIVPPVFYIDQLMQCLGRPYYISLLSAAELHGAAHQRPQKLQVFTTKPTISISQTKNPYFRLYYRNTLSEDLIWRKNSETDTIAYSSPELTAVDLVQYSHLCGGLSNAATVLSELLEVTDFSSHFPALYEMSTVASLQRLGYIIEEVLGDSGQAAVLYECLKDHKADMRKILLDPVGNNPSVDYNTKWKIIENQQIEIDEI